MSTPAVTALYVPGDRPDRFDKAVAAGPDVVILDLEDAIAPDRKAQARTTVGAYLAGLATRGRFHVRINSVDSPWWEDDLEMLGGIQGLGGLRIPKVGGRDDVAAVARRAPHVPLHALVETAAGVESLTEIARAGVASIGLGEADLRSDLGVSDERALDWVRSRLVVAARAAGLPPPMMSVYPAISDDVGLSASCRRGRAFGFVGRSAVHPRQLPVIRAAFAPTAGEVGRARAVLHALELARQDRRGVAVLSDGQMVDSAMKEGAARVLALAELLGVERGLGAVNDPSDGR